MSEMKVISDREFVISRVINAPRARVFKAWTDPKQMAKWFAPAPLTVPACELDPVPGGIFSLTMRMNGEDFPMKGEFREVVEPEKIVYTNDLSAHPAEFHARLREWGAIDTSHSLVTVSFEEKPDNKTLLTVRTLFDSTATRDAFLKMQMGEGWTQGLAQLDMLVSGVPDRIVVSRPFNAPIEKVWKAISDRDTIKEWFFDSSNFAAEVGCEFDFMGGPPEHQMKHLCKVLDVIPQQRLSYTWRFDGLVGDSVVTFELVPVADGTRLTFTHDGVPSFTPNGPGFTIAAFTPGWMHLFHNVLKSYLERE